ncbi:ATP-binding protein [Marinicrinis sediminis]|uniref:histidine kinase n=1 Tax=Marinicrinis sediminis TaxID=1652465 RepID=A0ABW5RFM7_9BACL
MMFPLQLQIPFTMDEIAEYINHYCYQSVMIVSRDGTILCSNDTLLQILGYEFNEIISYTVQDMLVDSVDIAELAEWIRDADSLEQIPVIEVSGKNGERHVTSVSVFEVQQQKMPHSYFIVFHDLYLPPSFTLLEKFSSALLRDVNLGVLLLDRNFNLVDISETACQILGVVRPDVLNQSMDHIFDPVPKEYQFIQRSILDGAVVRNHAFIWTNQNKRYELLLDANVIKDATERVVGAYIIFKDVSNLRSLEEQVQRSDRLAMIGQIAAGTAHEIRNPLTSIKGFLQVFKKTMLEHGLEKEFEYTELMLTEINRINDLVSEFLMLSKPKELHLKPVHVSTVIREILPIINNEAILHNITVKYESEVELPEVIADKELLKQVCINISKNGIEAMDHEGVLNIRESIDHEQCKIMIEIHDTGPGIPSFMIDKIFDPFFTTKESGTGLGLSVCQRIIHDLGGNIRVSSKGFGTTFTISLPYKQSSRAT